MRTRGNERERTYGDGVAARAIVAVVMLTVGARGVSVGVDSRAIGREGSCGNGFGRGRGRRDKDALETPFVLIADAGCLPFA